jgi:hypothetical protein
MIFLFMASKIFCLKFSDIIRETDFVNKNGQKTVSKTEYILKRSDFIRVSCEGSDKEKYDVIFLDML